METYLALDLGGTKLMIGEVDADGNILRHKKYASGYLTQTAALVVIKASLNDYIATVGWHETKPVGMGIGLVGRVDSTNGVWLQIDPSRTQSVAIAEELEKVCGIPCRADNDVKSATRAERLWGYGRQSGNFVYINVGTGIAAGCVVGGRLITGSHFNAGEVGHTCVGVNVGTKCCCGRTDCVETIAAGIGFDTCARLLKDSYPTSLTIPADTKERVDVREVYELSRKGDALCSVLVDNAAAALASLIMNLVRVTDPDTVVLGGGIVSDGYMYNKVCAMLQAETMRFVTNGVVITQLNPDFIGLLGAAAVAMNK